MGIYDFPYFILIEIKFVSCSEIVSDFSDTIPPRSLHVTHFSLADTEKWCLSCFINFSLHSLTPEEGAQAWILA